MSDVEGPTPESQSEPRAGKGGRAPAARVRASQTNGDAPTEKAPAPRPPARTWLRILLPAALILTWLALGGTGGPYFGKVSEVSSNEQASYLPQSAEATRVQEALTEFSDVEGIPAIVVFVGDHELSADDLDDIREALTDASAIEGVGGEVSPPIPSQDGRAAQAFVPLKQGGGVATAAAALGDHLRANAPAGVEVFVTGPAGLLADLLTAFSGIDGLLLMVALLAVLIILVLVYRSALLPLAVLATSIFALSAAILVVWWLAKWEVVMLSGQTQGILFILVIGAATDYSLLLVARFREELRHHADKAGAVIAAVKGSVEPIVASGSTVIVGLLCLLLSDLKSNSTLGPVAAIGIAFAMLSALTFLPAILFALGRAAFWPRIPAYDPHTIEDVEGGLWARVGRRIARRPRMTWAITLVVLLMGALGVTQLNASGVPQSELALGASEARDGQAALAEHFPAGSGSPVMVVVQEREIAAAVEVLLDHPGVAGVSVASADSPSGSAPMTLDGPVAIGPPGTPAPEPTVVDGRVLLQGTLNDAPDSAAAGDTVRELRAAFGERAPSALVGGVSAIAVDTNDASIHDRNLIIPIVLLVITLILMLLLRAVLVAILLISTTVISFGTAMGVAALVFNGIFDFPGADPAVPLFGFVFLVALGIDYNIFLMTRVREETLKSGTRTGVLRGLAVTGGVITSAGVVLAATFAALAVIPILFLAQLAFIVAFGVLLDTFIVRSLLVPALVYDIGPAVWWPSKLSRGGGIPRGGAISRAGGASRGEPARDAAGSDG